MALADTQQGASITFETGGAFNVIRISRLNRQKPIIDTTHLGTQDQRTKRSGDLEDIQTFEVEVQNDPTLDPAPLGTQQDITVTGPTPPGGVSGESYAGTGFCSQIQDAEFNAGTEALQTKILTIQFDGGDGADGTQLARTAASMT